MESMPPSLAVIEIDAFCERCGFNLRSRPVTRDERLGILVCQCPECGAYQSATNRATALTPWLHRLALVAAILWVGLSLAYAAAVFGSLFGLQAAAYDGFTVRAMHTPDGTPVRYDWSNGKQTLARADGVDEPVPSNTVIVSRQLVPFLGGPTPAANGYYYYRQADDAVWALLGTALSIAGVYTAFAVIAAGTWFWRPTFRWLWLLMPIVVAVTVTALIRSEDRTSTYYAMLNATEQSITTRHDHSVDFAVVALVALAQAVIAGIALMTGRKFIRGLLRVFTPPGMRQLFAFLWHCDGKTMPPARAASEPR